jgi:hypothetical protein
VNRVYHLVKVKFFLENYKLIIGNFLNSEVIKEELFISYCTILYGEKGGAQ